MGAARTGSLGVGTTKGDLYVVDENLELERIPVGADDEVLVADSTDPLGVSWQNITNVTKASIQADAVDAVFKRVDLGGGAISNPNVRTRGTHSVLLFDADALEGIPWQKYMPTIYTDGTDLDISIYWVSDGTDTGDALWGIALERDNAGFDIDVDGFAAVTSLADAAPGVEGEIVQTTITITGAALDGILKGEPFRLFVQRDGADVLDTLTDNAEIVRVVVEEV